MNPTSQTTARVAQPELQLPLQTQLEQVSSQCVGFPGRVRSWFSALVNRHIPYGYEDEAGFHYGTPGAAPRNQY